MLLTDEQQSVQEMARRFAQERLAPNAERWDREHHYPADAIAEMGRKARAVYEARYTADRNYVMLMAIYEDAMRARAAA